jgi:hypothetical protein
MRVANHARTSWVGPMLGYRWTWLLGLAFGVVLAVSWIRLVQMAIALPDGEWDAWTLWNLRAKFLAGPHDAWRYAVSPLLYGTHSDYPLLLSAFVARVWKAGSAVDTIAPVVTGFVFFAALLALLVSALALLKGAASALLAGLVMLSTTSLLTWAPAQYADIPLAFYYLGAVALVLFESLPSSGGRWTLFWAGLCAGLAAWTKNEGVAFLVCILIVFSALTLWQRGMRAALSRTVWLTIGALPGVLLTLWFKFFLAPAADPLVIQGASGLARLHDLNRYAQVAGSFFNNLLSLGTGVAHPLILLAILALLLRWQIEESYRLPTLMASAVLTLVFLSYCLVFLITPYTLDWQLRSSFDRLILQVWPSALLVFFVLLRSVVDAAPPPVLIKNAVTRKSAGLSGKPALAGKKLK